MIPLAKSKAKQNELSCFRPMSVLNTFSIVYERLI